MLYQLIPQKVKKWHSRLVHFGACWKHQSMLLMAWQMVPWRSFTQICTWLRCWTAWEANWQNFQSRSIGFRSGKRGGAGNDVDSFIFQELPASSHHIVVHQQEARTHCTSIGSDNGSKDFILISNGRCVEMPDDVTGSLTLFTVSPDPFTSGRCVQGKPTLNCKKHEVPILVFYGKCN